MIGCDDRVMSPHGYPRLIDPCSGTVITEWPGVAVPAKSGCYGVTDIPTRSPLGIPATNGWP